MHLKWPKSTSDCAYLIYRIIVFFYLFISHPTRCDNCLRNTNNNNNQHLSLLPTHVDNCAFVWNEVFGSIIGKHLCLSRVVSSTKCWRLIKSIRLHSGAHSNLKRILNLLCVCVCFCWHLWRKKSSTCATTKLFQFLFICRLILFPDCSEFRENETNGIYGREQELFYFDGFCNWSADHEHILIAVMRKKMRKKKHSEMQSMKQPINKVIHQ